MINDLLEGKKVRDTLTRKMPGKNGSLIIENDEEDKNKEELTVEGLKGDLAFQIGMIEEEVGKLERYIDVTESIRERLNKISMLLMQLKEMGIEELSAREYLTRGLRR